MATKWVYEFSEGSKEMKDLLGGKGSGLAEMSNLGLPVPPGFTITTEACRAYMENGDLPDGLMENVAEHLSDLEEATGKRLGDPADPLLVSVRSGAEADPGKWCPHPFLRLRELKLQLDRPRATPRSNSG